MRRLAKVAMPLARHDPALDVIKLIQEWTVVRVMPFRKLPSTVCKSVLRALAKDGGCRKSGLPLVPSDEEIKYALLELAGTCGTNRRLHRESGRGQRWRTSRNTAHLAVGATRLNYSNLQETYFNKETGRVARLDSASGLCPIKLKGVTRYFRSKWEAKEEFKGLGQFGSAEVCKNLRLAGAITSLEVVRLQQRIKKNSASGPDGLTKGCLVKWDSSGVKLARAFGSIPLWSPSKDFQVFVWGIITTGSALPGPALTHLPPASRHQGPTGGREGRGFSPRLIGSTPLLVTL